jgi:hypothetical protein
MSGSLTKGKNNEPGVAVKYVPCSKGDTEHTDDELEEIAIMGNEKHDEKKKDLKGGYSKPTANGPQCSVSPFEQGTYLTATPGSLFFPFVSEPDIVSHNQI